MKERNLVTTAVIYFISIIQINFHPVNCNIKTVQKLAQSRVDCRLKEASMKHALTLETVPDSNWFQGSHYVECLKKLTFLNLLWYCACSDKRSSSWQLSSNEKWRHRAVSQWFVDNTADPYAYFQQHNAENSIQASQNISDEWTISRWLTLPRPKTCTYWMLPTVGSMQEWNYSVSFHQQLKYYIPPNSY